MSGIKLCLRNSAVVLGALALISPPAVAGNSAEVAVAKMSAGLRPATLKVTARMGPTQATAATAVTLHTSGFVTTAITALDLSKLHIRDFGDDAR